jgi:uncharacterized SAM-binding protein YcdF (DUF218 family)
MLTPVIKFFPYALFPVSLSLFVLSIGVAYLWADQKQKRARLWITLGWTLFLLFSNRLVGQTMLSRLEDRYPAHVADKSSDSAARLIVVLGGLTNPRTDIPISSRLNGAMMARLVEGIRLHRELPGSKLLLSGGGGILPEESDAAVMRQMALALGVNDRHLILESASTNTYEEALLVKKIIGEQPFILVTSAGHMPRAMALFAAQGLHPIPAPTHYLLRGEIGFQWNWFLPSMEGLELSSAAIYEYLGIVKDKLLGHF